MKLYLDSANFIEFAKAADIIRSGLAMPPPASLKLPDPDPMFSVIDAT
jgi:hypothetical protein